MDATTQYENFIDSQELTRLTALASSNQRLDTFASPSQALLRGSFKMKRQYGDILLHSTAVTELQNTSVSAELEPGLSMSVLLEGELQFGLAGQSFSIQANEGPKAFAFNLTKTTRWQRQLRKGTSVRKVNISVSHKWLVQHLAHSKNSSSGALLDFFSKNRAFFCWPAESSAALADTLLKDAPQTTLASEIQHESRTLNFIAQLMLELEQNLDNDKFAQKSLGDTNTAFPKAKPIAEYLQKEIKLRPALHEAPSLQTIADAMGMSVSTLQRHFKSAYGRTVKDHMHNHRMLYIRDKLAQKNLSIGEATYICGYRHPSNFCSAFKRHFGVSPRKFMDAIDQ